MQINVVEKNNLNDSIEFIIFKNVFGVVEQPNSIKFKLSLEIKLILNLGYKGCLNL